MLDLHLHLDGSLAIEDFKYLSKLEGIELPNDFPNCIYVQKDCKSLAEYLEKFDLPLKLMQSERAIEYVTYSLVKRLYSLNYIYAEIRFAPLLHLEKGLDIEKVTLAAIKGLKRGIDETKDFDANLILCCMRHASEKDNLETIRIANKYRYDKVCAVDLAGDECLHPSSFYKNVFDLAKEHKLNITIHAGESTDTKEIIEAIDNGAMRIGHGVHLEISNMSLPLIKSKQLCFEFCPTSNLQTKSLKEYKDVPINIFLNAKIPFTINADNMTVSDTDAIKEMRLMIEHFGLNKQQVYSLYKNAINYSFTDEKQKSTNKNLLKSKFDAFYIKYLL